MMGLLWVWLWGILALCDWVFQEAWTVTWSPHAQFFRVRPVVLGAVAVAGAGTFHVLGTFGSLLCLVWLGLGMAVGLLRSHVR